MNPSGLSQANRGVSFIIARGLEKELNTEMRIYGGAKLLIQAETE